MDEFTSEILTAEELERCKEVFDAFNKNANEGIEQSDLSTILKCNIYIYIYICAYIHI